MCEICVKMHCVKVIVENELIDYQKITWSKKQADWHAPNDT